MCLSSFCLCRCLVTAVYIDKNGPIVQIVMKVCVCVRVQERKHGITLKHLIPDRCHQSNQLENIN